MIAADQRRLDIARQQRVHADAVRRVFDGEAARQRRHRALGRRIDRHLPRVLARHDRGEIDHRGVARRLQQVEGLARAAHRAVEIGLPHPVPRLVGEMAEVRPLAHARIVDQHVEPAMRFADRLHQRLDLSGVGDIDLVRGRGAIRHDDRFGHLFRRLAVAVGHHHERALAREGLGDGPADPCPAARHQRDLVLKPPHLTPPPASAPPICGASSPVPRRRSDAAPWSRRTAPWSRRA